MSYVQKEKKFEMINFLKSSKTTQFTTQVDDSHPDVVDGYLPAGSVVPANDATAQGILVNGVDVTKGAQEAAMIVEGHILKERLPKAPTDAAYAAMMNITLYDGDEKPIAKVVTP